MRSQTKSGRWASTVNWAGPAEDVPRPSFTQITVKRDGSIRGIDGEEIDLAALGTPARTGLRPDRRDQNVGKLVMPSDPGG
jgi:hypothetical protein